MTHNIGVQTYMRRGYSLEDAEAAWEEWSKIAENKPMIVSTLVPGDAYDLLKKVWLAGWHARGQVAYGEPDSTEPGLGNR